MTFLQRVRRDIRMGAWAGREGWRRARGRRCAECGAQVYVREGDFACLNELLWRWERRSDASPA